MTTAMRKLPTVLAGVAVWSSLLANCVLAAQNDAQDVRNVHGVIPEDSPACSYLC